MAAMENENLGGASAVRTFILVYFWVCIADFLIRLGLMSMDHPRTREPITLGGEVARALGDFSLAVLLAWLLWAS